MNIVSQLYNSSGRGISCKFKKNAEIDFCHKMAHRFLLFYHLL
jgi:hypothetical protein